jgi:hypothetical protein
MQLQPEVAQLSTPLWFPERGFSFLASWFCCNRDIYVALPHIVVVS